MSIRLALFLGLAAGVAFPQSAPSNGIPATPRQFAASLVSDQKAIWTSPFRMNKRQWLNTALPLVGGTAALIAIDKRAVRGLPNTPDQLKWSGRVSNAGAAYSLFGATLLPAVVGKITKKPEISRGGISAAEALVDSFAVIYVMKYAFGRERPDQPNGNSRFFHGGISFPSGHAMSVWAAAAATGYHRHTPRWLTITAYAAATAVSLSRVGAQRHHPADIFAGSAMGFLIGRYVGRKNAD